VETLNKIGNLYIHHVIDYDKALEFYLKSYEISEATFGELYPGYETSLSSIALIYNSKGDYAKALDNYFKLLGKMKNDIG